MRYWLVGALFLVGCNKVGYDAVTIRPTYGWEDGCTTVKISGHGFGNEVSATINGNEVASITRPEDEADHEWYFFGDTPAWTGTEEEGRFGTVTVTSDGEESTIEDAFYYVACPGPGYIESVSPDAGITAGDTISLGGCGLAAGYQAQLYDTNSGTPQKVGTAAALTSTCGTAFADFVAPDLTTPRLAANTYWLAIEDADGNIVNPSSGDITTCDRTEVDSDAPADTDLDTVSCFSITYGGGE